MRTYKLLFFFLVLLLSNLVNAFEIKVGMINTGGDTIGYDEKFVGEYASLRDRLNCIFNSQNINASVSVYPVSRLEVMLQKGALDIALPFSRTESRFEYAVHLSPIVVTRYYLLSKRSLNGIPNEDLKVGAIIGSADLSIARHNGYDVQSKYKYNQMFKMLQLDRLDGVVAPDAILENLDPQLHQGLHQSVLENKALSIYVSNASKNK